MTETLINDYKKSGVIHRIIRRFLYKLKIIHRKYIGVIEYVVTITNVSGEIQRYIFYSVIKVNDFVTEINDNKYWNIQKIEKLRRQHFEYFHEIIHTPLWFQLENVTETAYVGDSAYSFLVKDESLKNIKRVDTN